MTDFIPFVGHLSHEEAKQLWEKEVASRGFFKSNMLKFEEINNICGGNMFLLQELYYDYVISGIHLTNSFYLYIKHS